MCCFCFFLQNVIILYFIFIPTSERGCILSPTNHGRRPMGVEFQLLARSPTSQCRQAHLPLSVGKSSLALADHDMVSLFLDQPRNLQPWGFEPGQYEVQCIGIQYPSNSAAAADRVLLMSFCQVSEKKRCKCGRLVFLVPSLHHFPLNETAVLPGILLLRRSLCFSTVFTFENEQLLWTLFP